MAKRQQPGCCGCEAPVCIPCWPAPGDLTISWVDPVFGNGSHVMTDTGVLTTGWDTGNIAMGFGNYQRMALWCSGGYLLFQHQFMPSAGGSPFCQAWMNGPSGALAFTTIECSPVLIVISNVSCPSGTTFITSWTITL